MPLFADNFFDEVSGRPIEGAEVFVYDLSGDTEIPIQNELGANVSQPILTGVDGDFAFQATAGTYQLLFRKNGRRLFRDRRIMVGTPGTVNASVGGFGSVLVANDTLADARADLLINPFTMTEIAVATIPTIVDRVRISDRGNGIFVRFAGNPATHPAAAKVQDASGQWWGLSLDQTITPFMLGAQGWNNATYGPGDVATTAPDDAIPLQAFYDFVWSGGCKAADDTGLWATSVGIIYGPASAAVQRRVVISGNATIVAKGAITNLLTLRNTKENHKQGSWRLVGTGLFQYTTRTCQNAIRFVGNNVSSGVTGEISAYYFQNWAIDADAETLGTDFIEWFACPHIYAIACGSGDIDVNPAYSVTATYNTRVNTGSAGSAAQRTTITVGTLPPTFIDANLGKYPHAVIMNGKTYQIMSVDRANSKISVYPWMLSGDPATGSLTYVFGGAIVEHGVDANLLNIGAISGIFCGFTRLASSAYPGMFNNVTAQNTAIAVGVGIAPNSTCRGGGVVDLYPENNVKFQFVGFSSGRKEFSNVNFAILNGHEIMAEKFYAIEANDGTNDAYQYGLEKYQLPKQVGDWDKGTLDIARGFADVDLSTGIISPTWQPWDNPLVRLFPIDANKYKATGRNSKVLFFGGSGANGQPTGTVTINANAIAGKLINGANTVTFTGLKTALAVLVSADPVTGNFTASRIGLPPPAAAIAAPTGGTVIDVESRAAINSIRAALTAANITS